MIALAWIFLIPAFGTGASHLKPQTLSGIPALSQLPTARFVRLATQQKYDEALELADSIEHSAPDQPQGYFFRMTILNNRSIDYEDERDREALEQAVDSVITICQRRIAESDSGALVRFYLGSTLGYKMIHSLRRKDYFDALRLGRQAADWLEAAIAKDSACYDAYAGLGNYYYFLSRYSWILRSAGLVRDRREQGISLLRKAAAYGCLTQSAAASSIAWIWIDKEQPDSAERIARDLLAEYPDNRAFLWCLGRSLKMMERWEETINVYQQLLKSIRLLLVNNHLNEIGCLNSIGCAYYELGQWAEVVSIANEALELQITPDIASRKAKDLSRLRALRREALEILKRKQTNAH